MYRKLEVDDESFSFSNYSYYFEDNYYALSGVKMMDGVNLKFLWR